jgi:hypothetical protein
MISFLSFVKEINSASPCKSSTLKKRCGKHPAFWFFLALQSLHVFRKKHENMRNRGVIVFTPSSHLEENRGNFRVFQDFCRE